MNKMPDYPTVFNRPPMPPRPAVMPSLLIEAGPYLGPNIQDTVPVVVAAETTQLMVGQIHEAVVGVQDTQVGAEPQSSEGVSNHFLRYTGIVLSAIALTAVGSYVVGERDETAHEQQSIVRAIEQASKEKGLKIVLDESADSDYLGYNKELELNYVDSGAGMVVFGDNDRCVDYADISVQVTQKKSGEAGKVHIEYTFVPKPDENSGIPVELQNLKPVVVYNEQEMREVPYFAGCFPETRTSKQ